MERATISDQAYIVLKEKILAHELLPGTKLQEIDLASELGVSRTPLRQAITRLAQEGLVTVQSRRGAYVVKLSIEEVTEILEVRKALECQAVRLAARKASKEQINDLWVLLKQRKEQLAKLPVDLAPALDFHQTIVKLSQNGKLLEFMDHIHNQLNILRLGSSYIAGRAEEVLEEHKKIVEALEARDPDLAEEHMRTHLKHAQENIMRNVVGLRKNNS